jgi:hypothetical protein
VEQTKLEKYWLISKAQRATVGNKEGPECRYKFSLGWL